MLSSPRSLLSYPWHRCTCTGAKYRAPWPTSFPCGRTVHTACLLTLLWQVLQFFTYMGMRHAYKAPLLLVQGPVLEEYAGGVHVTAIYVSHRACWRSPLCA